MGLGRPATDRLDRGALGSEEGDDNVCGRGREGDGSRSVGGRGVRLSTHLHDLLLDHDPPTSTAAATPTPAGTTRGGDEVDGGTRMEGFAPSDTGPRVFGEVRSEGQGVG